MLSENKIKASPYNGKPYLIILCVSTHQSAHRTTARCNDDDGDVILFFSFVILLMPQSYNNN